MKTEMTVTCADGGIKPGDKFIRVIAEAARQSIIEAESSPVWTDVQSISVTVRKSWRKELGSEVKIPTLLVCSRATIVERAALNLDL